MNDKEKKIAELIYEICSCYDNKKYIGSKLVFEQMKDKFLEAHKLAHELDRVDSP